MLTGNKGEWSEVYVLLKLLAEGKIYAADSELNQLNDVYFPILKVIREEKKDQVTEYCTGENISIYINGSKIKDIPASEFQKECNNLLFDINSQKTKGTFSIENTENFMNKIFCYRLSAPSTTKSDITIKIIDINTGYSPTVGFSIKSELGSSPTLLNASKSTNFIYKINNCSHNLSEQVNNIYKVISGKNHTDIKGRLTKITQENKQLTYHGMESQVFNDNLVLIDSNMDQIIAETILYFQRDGISKCDDIVKKLEEENPLNYGNLNAYRYKFKKFLSAIALGMKPATIWDGTDQANGGYIIVTKEGNVLAYHIYNRNCFEEYLLKYTKYETASTSRNNFGSIFNERDEFFIKLNLQIRFI